VIISLKNCKFYFEFCMLYYLHELTINSIHGETEFIILRIMCCTDFVKNLFSNIKLYIYKVIKVGCLRGAARGLREGRGPLTYCS